MVRGSLREFWLCSYELHAFRQITSLPSLIFLFWKLRILIYLRPAFQCYHENQRQLIDMKEFCHPESTVKMWSTVGEAEWTWIQFSLSQKPGCEWGGERWGRTGLRRQRLLLLATSQQAWEVRGGFSARRWDGHSALPCVRAGLRLWLLTSLSDVRIEREHSYFKGWPSSLSSFYPDSFSPDGIWVLLISPRPGYNNVHGNLGVTSCGSQFSSCPMDHI